jgi:hypothetical protein
MKAIREFVFKVFFVVLVLKKINLKKCSYMWLVGFRHVFGKNYG